MKKGNFATEARAQPQRKAHITCPHYTVGIARTPVRLHVIYSLGIGFTSLHFPLHHIA